MNHNADFERVEEHGLIHSHLTPASAFLFRGAFGLPD
jgi:hypothetical protein